MDIDRICCRCNKPLLTGYYYFNNKFGICIDCITKLSVLEIRNENQLHIKEVEAALKKMNKKSQKNSKTQETSYFRKS